MKQASENKESGAGLLFLITIFLLLAPARTTPLCPSLFSSPVISERIFSVGLEKERAISASMKDREVRPEVILCSEHRSDNKNEEDGSSGRQGVLEEKKIQIESKRDEVINQAGAELAKKEAAEKKDEEVKLKPSFRNIKEKVGTYAFLAWVWLVIAVLLYILNEQIKEADRRHRLGL